MLRLVVLCAVAVSFTSVFVAPLGGIEHTTRATPRVALHAKEASDRDGKHGNTNETPMMAILVGLALGLALVPSAWAGTGSGRPDFQLVRPSYMQGIDAANAAVKPGEIDYVTRSRIEAAQFPKALKEMEMTRVKLEAAPTKEERVKASLKQLRQYSGIKG
mmetsp:Transcript_10357/g.14533  ORF Transcript_10357/g.14533 Transcript_10357/m.14533 type:complete len:161 (-) Transcript_10357:147-629(-)|eukprot:symbB.v1.2.002192.t1/scaffold96.1/size336774/9